MRVRDDLRSLWYTGGKDPSPASSLRSLENPLLWRAPLPVLPQRLNARAIFIRPRTTPPPHIGTPAQRNSLSIFFHIQEPSQSVGTCPYHVGTSHRLHTGACSQASRRATCLSNHRCRVTLQSRPTATGFARGTHMATGQALSRKGPAYTSHATAQLIRL